MKVLKFGGTSVSGAVNIRRIADICNENKSPIMVVVSAMHGVTNSLDEMCLKAQQSNGQWRDMLNKVEQDHLNVINDLFPPLERGRILAGLKCRINEVEELLQGVEAIQEISKRVKDRILGYGELLSAFIIAKYLPQGVFVDARQLLVTNSKSGNARILPLESQKKIDLFIKELKGTAVITGFIGSSKKGIPTTLGRGGSDYSASFLAAAIKASALEIWTDVDGMMTADPRVTSRAVSLPRLTYAEAMELSHFGARVVYAPALQPVYEADIPTYIKNTFNRQAEGSCIKNSWSEPQGGADVKGVSSHQQIALINLKGSGLMGKSGISSRFFEALAKADVNVILISQASSEYSLTVAIDMCDLSKACKSLEEAFALQMQQGSVDPVEIVENRSIIAIVGDQMRQTPGIAGKLFMALGRNGISVEAIAQGSSERNISFVVNSLHERKAVEVIHNAFFMDNNVELNVFVAGVGNVGKELLKQIQKQQESLLNEEGIDMKVKGIANSSKFISSIQGLDLIDWSEQMSQRAQSGDIDNFIEDVIAQNNSNCVFVDCSASNIVASKYKSLLSKGISVVTANKIACSSSFDHYQQLNHMARRSGVRFLYETNVGAGLPILGTIRDLVKSGDKPQKIEAVLSGTLNFILNEVNQGSLLSSAIVKALEQGYSEPDPRIDLSGVDVERKLLILARESGKRTEAVDIKRTPLLPSSILSASWPNDFMKEVKKYDMEFEKICQDLKKKGRKMRYVATMDGDSYTVGLKEIEEIHPFYNLEASSNMLLITTNRYQHPMEIKGYGAGAAVTAAGVFADLMKVGHI